MFKVIWLFSWLLEKFFYYVIGFGCVCFWRGIWYFWDRYILVGDLFASAWLSHVLGFTCLTLVFASKSVVAPPGLIILDGGETNLFVLDLPAYHRSDPVVFFRSLFTKEKDDSDSDDILA